MEHTFSLCWRFEENPSQTNSPLKTHGKTWRDATHQTVFAHLYTFTSLSNTFDLMTDQICFLGSVWSALSEYHIRFYVRPSESTVWIWFRNYSCLDLNFCCDCTMFAQTFKGFIIIGAISKFNTVCLEISSTNKLK